VRILKDLFAPKQCKMQGCAEVRNLKELGVLRGGGLFEITRANIPQIWTFINSKLKFNRMNGVEGKFKKPHPLQMRKECGTLRRPGRSLTCEGRCHPPFPSSSTTS